jgi:hypothetical protein
LRRGDAGWVSFASLGAETVVGVAAALSGWLAALSGWLSVSLRPVSPRSGRSSCAIRARSALAGAICTTGAAGGCGLSIWPKT